MVYGHEVVDKINLSDSQSFIEEMESKTPFQKMFGDDFFLTKCDRSQFPFDDQLSRLICEKGWTKVPVPLECLHEHLDEAAMRYNSSELNLVSESLFETNSDFAATYVSFVRDFLQNQVFKTPLYFQATPTLRCHFPNAKGFDWPLRYHTDVMLGHPPQSINIWMPLTDCRNIETLRLGPLAGSLELFKRFDYHWPAFVTARDTDPRIQEECGMLCPVVHPAAFEALIFDARCLHAGQLIRQGITRVSMDIRVFPVDAYSKLKVIYQGTGRRKMKFQPGEYYDIRRSDEL